MKRTLTFILLFATIFLLPAQEWKKQSKKADKLFKEGQLENAATLYESAWEKKKNKTELMYKAGECYYELKDFRRATEAYRKVKNATGEAGLAGLKYARSLKQTGQYELAKEELVYYIKRYKADDKKVVSKIVQTEIEGCELALDIAKDNSDLVLMEHLSENINTLEDEFAPLPFSDDILYFSSTTGNKINMYRSQRQSGVWTQAVIPDLPKISGGIVCNGSFSPDNQRFYFTVCESGKKWSSVKAPCEIYMTKRRESSWSDPQKLHDYIRDDGSTASHPFVIHQGNEEVLFFVSDRDGGFGGMDIWFTKRQIKADDIDFSLPQNAGPMINTLGDEVSPYYNELKEELFFSSNGHPAIGGYDIFKAKDLGGRFGAPENLGLPLNSATDDYFYIEDRNGNGGFLVSNRLFGLEKITSTHDDVFFFSSPREQIVISGLVYNQKSQQPIESVVASLFEIKGNSRQRLLQAKTFPNGEYEFVLLPNKEYCVLVEQAGFGSSKYTFSTFHHETTTSYTRDFELSEGVNSIADATVSNEAIHVADQGKPVSSRPTIKQTTPSPPNPRTRIISGTNNIYTASSQNSASNNTSSKQTYKRRKSISEAPTHSGIYYKVQLTVVINYNSNHSQFREVKNMGRLDTEFLPEKNWNRVLLADFFAIEEAHVAMVKAQKLGFFDAFLVKYRDGKRVTP